MTHFPQPHPQQRATRIQLGNSVPAMVKLDGGERTKASVRTISVTGGLLQMTKALDEGDFVEVAFETHSGPVHGMAEMLHPRQVSTNGILQAFRFVALEDEDHKTLRFAVDSTLERKFLLGSTQYSGSQS